MALCGCGGAGVIKWVTGLVELRALAVWHRTTAAAASAAAAAAVVVVVVVVVVAVVVVVVVAVIVVVVVVAIAGFVVFRELIHSFAASVTVVAGQFSRRSIFAMQCLWLSCAVVD